MKDRFLKQIFKAFEMMNRCWNSEDNAAGTVVEDSDNQDANKDVSDNTPGDDQVDGGGDEEYCGSKDTNPNQMPLTEAYSREVKEGGYSKEKIDQDISLDPSIVSTTRIDDKKEPDKNTEGDKGAKDTKKENPDGDVEKKDTQDSQDDDDVNVFMEKTGLTKEEFDSLSETTQSYLTEKYESDSTSTNETKKIKDDYDSYKQSVDQVLNDPIMSARLKEQQTGRAYIPKTVSDVTQEEFDAFEDAETVQDRNKVVLEIINKRVEPVVNNHFIEKQNAEKLDNAKLKSFEIFKKIGELDKEFSFDVDDYNKAFDGISKEKDKHPNWSGYQNGIGKIVQYLLERNENFYTISKKSEKEILSAYNAATGRDQKIAQKIANNTKQTLLEKIKNAKMAKLPNGRKKANTMKGADGSNGRPSTGMGSSGSDRSTLVADLAAGNTAEYDRLGDIYAYDPDKLKYLDSIWQEAMEVRNKN